jgi:RNA polymerase sigma factor for flagellar operon FliA
MIGMHTLSECPSADLPVSRFQHPRNHRPRSEGDRGTKDLREEQILTLLPLVRHIAGRLNLFLPPHLSQEDLISAGVIGLIDAVDRFDASKGASLRTYCGLRIRGAILDELRRQGWAPRSVLKESRMLAETQHRLAQELGREPQEEELRKALNLSPEHFGNLLERTRPVLYFSLQEAVCSTDDGALLHEDILADPSSPNALLHLLQAEDLHLVQKCLQSLPQQQLQVLTLYYLEDLRLKEIAEILGITESRVSQIHTLALTRLRTLFHKARGLDSAPSC